MCPISCQSPLEMRTFLYLAHRVCERKLAVSKGRHASQGRQSRLKAVSQGLAIGQCGRRLKFVGRYRASRTRPSGTRAHQSALLPGLP